MVFCAGAAGGAVGRGRRRASPMREVAPPPQVVGTAKPQNPPGHYGANPQQMDAYPPTYPGSAYTPPATTSRADYTPAPAKFPQN